MQFQQRLLSPSKERLPSELSGGKRHPDLFSELPGQSGGAARQHLSRSTNGQDWTSQNYRCGY